MEIMPKCTWSVRSAKLASASLCTHQDSTASNTVSSDSVRMPECDRYSFRRVEDKSKNAGFLTKSEKLRRINLKT